MKRFNIKNLKKIPSKLLFLVLSFVAIFLFLRQLTDFAKNTQSLSYTAFIKEVKNGNVYKVKIDGNVVKGVLKKNGQYFESIIPNDNSISNLLLENNVDVVFSLPSSDFNIFYIFLSILLIGIPLVIWFFLRQAKNATNSSGGIFGMAKNKAKMFMPSQIKVNFNSVAGAEEAKEELADIVDYLRDPEKYKKLGAKLTKGVLLVGEPGNGKTLLAKALAGEANCPFFSTNGSDFIEIFVGVGSARVKDLFMQARRHAPSIIFIDEIDTLGKQRGLSGNGGNEEREQTLNQLLAEMDGFDSSSHAVIVIGATNRPDVLDKALLRPGRFDRKVYVPFPSLKSREDILKVHAQNVKIDQSIDLHNIARKTPGFSGADLANLINEAAIIASKNNQPEITIENFEEARDKIMLGKEIKAIRCSDEEIKITAFHEAGHALVNLLIPEHLDPLHKVTIIPRGNALGVTHSLPESDKYLRSKDEMLANICKGLGGRVAEEVVFNKITTGASNDFDHVTKIARNMVRIFGMSDLGVVVYNSDEISNDSYNKIDQEVQKILNKCYIRTKQLITDNIDKLHILANSLLENKTLFAKDIYKLLNIPPREQHLLSE